MLICLVILLTGCWPQSNSGQSQKTEDKSGKSGTGIIGQTTDDIGELQQGHDIVNSKPQLSGNPLTGALESYGPAIETLSKGQIRQALEMYRANKGDYPKTHDEFMTGVIKQYKIRLPVLPAGRQYKYDVSNHKLVVVKGAP